ncbi:hypothetical protein NQ314_013420 [Rhamnusium bicolor]|uniref:Kinesin-like protein n=1 Tax=Rhamnusium bicolor TaxID=1586634 RepID=A0AAV8X8S2_9CUCU|nr:hypothetical protein NQ314_013420 [Rhamnusium bicolor]
MTSTEAENHSTERNSNEAVQVIVRCRPLSEKEIDTKCTSVVRMYPSRGVIEVENPRARSENEKNKIFTYDAVYDENSTQQNLYDETVRPLVASVLEGYNGCVFAYGQTGTGKTYTMEGCDREEIGIIPRAFEQIWAHIDRKTEDLLRAKSTKNHELREVNGQGVVVTNLHSQTCQSSKDMLRAMKTGNNNRTTGMTNMNEHSSRSHAIFQIVIEMAEEHSKSIKVGKLNLVDLAGSERQSKTGATGDRLREATKINKALSSLGNVIYALAENSAHIPYRDSKLTRLLQDSLGGNSKTIMIANIGPASMNYEETIITLRYAYRAKSIKNSPVKNEDIKEGKLLGLQQEIERLKQLIMEKSNGEVSTNIDDVDEESTESEDESNKEEKVKKLELGKMEVDELAKKLKTLEKQMVHGGKNIVDSVNENELRLEIQRAEIAARKKREIEMQQKLELEEETCIELKQVFASLQQQVDFKREKLKRLNNKLQSIRQEIRDNHEVYVKDRQEIEEANDEAAIINPTDRPFAHNYRRPISDYAVQMSQNSPTYRGENVMDLKLDMPLRTTQEYTAPIICPQIKSIVNDVIRNEMENNHIIVKLPAHSVGRNSSKLEQEGKYKQATKVMVDMHNYRNRQTPKSAKAVFP